MGQLIFIELTFTIPNYILNRYKYAVKYTDGVKVGNDLVEEPETLQTLVVDALLGVKVREGRHTGEQHPDLGVALAVQVVVVARVGQEVGRHVGWQDVVDQSAVATLHVRCSFALGLHLAGAQEQHSASLLRLPNKIFIIMLHFIIQRFISSFYSSTLPARRVLNDFYEHMGYEAFFIVFKTSRKLT